MAAGQPEELLVKAQHRQTLEHIAHIERLEARVRELEALVSNLQQGGGTDELQRLPGQALRSLIKVFDSVPIPDLSNWERGQSLRKLSNVLEELERSGSLPGGTWSYQDDDPNLRVSEGDGATVARVTAEIVRVLGEVAGGYLAQMVEYQGTTPDHVSRARASHLMDVSSLSDVKAQYGLLPADGKQDLFEEHIDQLVHAKDQVYVISRWLNDARGIVRELLGKHASLARDASLLGLLEALANPDLLVLDTTQREAVYRVLVRCMELLPEESALQALGLADSTFQRTHRAGLSEEAGLPFLASALAALLADHETVASELRDRPLKSRLKKALALASRTRAGTESAARSALAKVAKHAKAVAIAQERLGAVHRNVVKRYAGLPKHARERIESGPTPEASAAAFERLTKEETRAYLAELWLELVRDLRRLLEDPEQGLVALRSQADTAPYQAERQRALDELVESLRQPPESEESFLSLATPIDVEAGLLDRQTAELEARIEEFLERYSRSKRNGVESLEDAVVKLSEVEELRTGKRAAIDKLFRKAYQGKSSPKKEAATARDLLAERRGIQEGQAALDERKAKALAHVGPQLERHGLTGAGSYDELLAKIQEERQRLSSAAALHVALAACEGEVVATAQHLDPDVSTPADVRSLLARTKEDARALEGLGSEVAQAQAKYVKEASGLLRGKPADYATARRQVDEIQSGLDTIEALRAAGESYVTRFSDLGTGLYSLEKIKAWVTRERVKAGTVKRAIETCSEETRLLLKDLGGKLQIQPEPAATPHDSE